MSTAGPPTGNGIVLNETIHQATRLRIMTVLVSVSESDRLAYGFIQETLGLTGGNLTIHLRKLQQAGYVEITKEFRDSKPRTWVRSTASGRRAFADYLSNLQRVLNFQPQQRSPGRQAGSHADRIAWNPGRTGSCRNPARSTGQPPHNVESQTRATR